MPTPKKRLDLVNTIFLCGTHALAPLAILYMIFGTFSWWTLGLGLIYFGFCGLSITGGYHRLFSHPTYRARGFLRFFYLFFGAASVQNSALKWSSDHRIHHGNVDSPRDPYNIKEGFWWAHVGWVFFKDGGGVKKPLNNVADLKKDKLVMLQHKYYLWFVALSLIVLPFGLGMLWGDPLGAVLTAGFLRLTLQWHATFSVNSVAHVLGDQPYSTKVSARDSVVTAIITLGEGYHNYHHVFAGDYRNGIRWFHFDPTKWFVWSCSKFRITWDLKRASVEAIERAKATVLAERAAHVA
jgi:stearoyl-CoA desaturase (delta-9 desaturase)